MKPYAPFLRILFLGLTMALPGGCDHTPESTPAAGHQHQSPHGGTLVELGSHQFQLDVVADRRTGAVDLWILDGHAENFVRIAAPTLELVLESPGPAMTLSLAARADTATGETVGDTSRFSGQHDALKVQGPWTGSIPRLEIRGSVFTNVRITCSISP